LRDDLAAAFQTFLAGDELEDGVVLVKINTTPAICRALNYSGSVAYAGDTYTGDIGAHSPIIGSLKGDRPSMSLTLQNQEDDDGNDLPWSTYLNANKITGVSVEFRFISIALAATANAAIAEITWKISGFEHDEATGDVVFNLTGPRDPLTLRTPSIPLGSTRCRWVYKHGPCTSQSAKPDCPFTIEGCRARLPKGSPLPIGPSMPFQTSPLRRT
jgi:hypothetical protein